MQDYKTIKKIDIHSHALPAIYANYFPPVYRGGCPLITDEQVFPFTFDEFLKDMVEKGEISDVNYCKIVRYNAEKLLNL